MWVLDMGFNTTNGWNVNTNESTNVIDTPATDTPVVDTPVVDTPATDTPATVPARRRGGRNRTPATVPAGPMPRTIKTLADAVNVAGRVTPANFAAMVERFNRDHGVTLAARNVGRLSGGRIMDVQNAFMADNGGLNDLGILFVWRVDFPAAIGRVFVADGPTGVGIVRGVRAEYNRNGHGSKSDTWRTVKSASTGPVRFDWPKSTAVKTA